VRLSKGDYSTKKVYSEHPLEVARMFEDHGFTHLHLVDLDGAKSQHIVNHRILEAIAAKTNLKVDFGGGVKSDADIERAFKCGAHQVTGGSIAVKDPARFANWIHQYGAEKIILGADCSNGKIVTQGWQQGSELDIIDFIKGYEQKGIRYVTSTDVAKDGMLQGVAESLYKGILAATSVRLIASGGVSCMEDVLLLEQIGCYGVIIGKAIYENKISLTQLAQLC
jgi:phosphoribosylformimino-5-aminoimidazole carboxamide ribotide isomerase